MERLADVLKRKEAEIGSLRQTVNAECEERIRLLAQLAAHQGGGVGGGVGGDGGVGRPPATAGAMTGGGGGGVPLGNGPHAPPHGNPAAANGPQVGAR